MNKTQALELLKRLQAPVQLIQHVILVSEATEILIAFMQQYDITIDAEFIRAGVIVHDIGKIIHTQELHEKGSQHEAEGINILRSHGVDETLARVCVSHGQFENMSCSIEELLIALSDKLWKGKRVETLETRIIDYCADALTKEHWDIFIDFDECFENIANQGSERLERSQSDIH